jgi:protein involved in polysaccharide export with SLBB domain/glycosyltransferase involved in cell wall biosynthesis
MSRSIVFLNRFYWPDVAATAQMLADLAEDLAAAGWSVTVITSRSGYSTTRPLARGERHNGVDIVRVSGTRFGRGRTIGRALDYVSYMVGALFQLLLLPRQNLVVAMSDPPLLVALAVLAARIRGGRAVYWVQDLFPELAGRLGVVAPDGSLYRASAAVARYLHAKCDAVVALGPRMAESMIAAGASPLRTTFVHNWADAAAIRPVPPSENRFMLSHALVGKFVVLYSGNAGRAHCFDAVIEAMRRLRDDPDVLFLFVGGGNKLPEIKAAVKRWRVRNAKFLDYVPRELLAQSLSAASVSLVTEDPDAAGLLVPSKTYGILASGRPVVFVGCERSDVATIVRDACCGTIVAPNDPATLVETIRRLKANPREGIALGRRGREAAEKMYDRRRATSRWASAVGSALQQTPEYRASKEMSLIRFLRERVTLSLLILSLSPVTATAQNGSSGSHAPAAAQLAPGDVIRITVWRKPEFSGDFVVAPDGAITHPLYKELRVTGMPFNEVESLVRGFLSRFEANPAFVVSPLLRVFVGGEVRQPSVYTFPPGTTVGQAVAQAGGPTERGRLDRVRLRRQTGALFLDVTNADARTAPEEIRSGDQIMVTRGRSFLRDYLAPTSSVIAALAAVASIIIQAGK